jgi:hypothetical protein
MNVQARSCIRRVTHVEVFYNIIANRGGKKGNTNKLKKEEGMERKARRQMRGATGRR